MAIVEDDDGVPVELATLVNPSAPPRSVGMRPELGMGYDGPNPPMVRTMGTYERLPIGHPYWVDTVDGDQFDFMRPTPDMFADIDTIAHGLSGINRFLGQTREPYNVAHHSRLVADLVPDEYKLAALLHDVCEFAFGDWPGPLIALLRHHQIRTLDFYVGLARDAASIAFGVPLNPTHPIVHRADMMMRAAEQRDLRGRPNVGGVPSFSSVPLVVPEPPAVSKARFLEMFYRLKGR